MLNHESMLPKIFRTIVQHLQKGYSIPNNAVTMTLYSFIYNWINTCTMGYKQFHVFIKHVY